MALLCHEEAADATGKISSDQSFYAQGGRPLSDAPVRVHCGESSSGTWQLDLGLSAWGMWSQPGPFHPAAEAVSERNRECGLPQRSGGHGGEPLRPNLGFANGRP